MVPSRPVPKARSLGIYGGEVFGYRFRVTNWSFACLGVPWISCAESISLFTWRSRQTCLGSKYLCVEDITVLSISSDATKLFSWPVEANSWEMFRVTRYKSIVGDKAPSMVFQPSDALRLGTEQRSVGTIIASKLAISWYPKFSSPQMMIDRCNIERQCA